MVRSMMGVTADFIKASGYRVPLRVRNEATDWLVPQGKGVELFGI